jgi:hypothetical protein
VIGPGPTGPVHPDGRLDVLSHAVGADAAHRAQRFDPQDGACAAPERRRPPVLGRGDDAVEDGLFVEDPTVALTLMLERLEVVEVLRRLHEGELRILEVRQQRGQEPAGGDVVRVEHGDQIDVEVRQSVVEITGLRVGVVRTRQVAGAERLREFADVLAVAVVQDPRLMSWLERDGRGDGREQDLAWFVVGRDQDRDAWGRAIGDGRRLRIEPPQRHRVEDEADRVVDLDDEHGDGDPPPLHRDGAGQAPEEIRRRDRDGGDGDRMDEQAPAARLGPWHRPVAERRRIGRPRSRPFEHRDVHEQDPTKRWCIRPPPAGTMSAWALRPAGPIPPRNPRGAATGPAGG